MPNSSARRLTCIGPAPPKPTRAKSRGSMPRCTVTTRMAAAIAAFTMSWTARAASTTSMPSGPATSRLERGSAALGRQRHAAGELRGVEVAEHEVGVGDGRLGAAAAVAGGAGIGARRPGADPEAAAVDGGDAAAPGAHLGQVDDRELERDAGAGAGAAEAALAADLEVVGDRGASVAHDARLGGGAAHVERDHVAGARGAPDEAGREHAGGAAGLDRGDGERGGAAAVITPPADSMTCTSQVMPRSCRRDPERVEVAGHHRPDERGHHGRHRPLVLAHLRPHLGRARRRTRPGNARLQRASATACSCVGVGRTRAAGTPPRLPVRRAATCADDLLDRGIAQRHEHGCPTHRSARAPRTSAAGSTGGGAGVKSRS